MSATMHGVDPRTGEPGPEIAQSTPAELDAVIAAAVQAARDPRLADAARRGAMMHGGPYPASFNAAATSVGMTAIQRFLRPVAFQNAPAALLPPALADDDPLAAPRRVNGAVS